MYILHILYTYYIYYIHIIYIYNLIGKDLLVRNVEDNQFDDKMSDMVSNRERTIDEMKIQTMYKVYN